MGQEAEQEQDEQGEPQGEAREQLACTAEGSETERRLRRPVSCLRFERARDYLLVAVRCVPVKA